MENRYQQFLENTLQRGLLELRVNPAAAEVVGIPRETFEILVRAFRSGLTKELEITLPHNLKDPAYLETLLSKIDILLSPGIPETVTSVNLPNVRELMAAYQEAEKFKEQVLANQQKWQLTFEGQIKRYNQDLINGLRQQLEKDLPSLPPEKREVLVKDLARTIQDQALPAIDLSWQTKDKLQEVSELTLKNYASEVEKLRTDPELVSKIAQRVAQEQETATWEVRSSQISATKTPPTFAVDLNLRTAIIANLPSEIYQKNPQIVGAITEQVLGRLSLPALAQLPTPEEYQQALSQEIQAAIASPKVQELMRTTEVSLSLDQQEKISSSAAQLATPTAQEWSRSPQATMAGVTAAGPAAPTMPPISLGQVRLAPGVLAEEGGLIDIAQSEGAPLHSLAALASPRAGESFVKWLATLGPVRAPLGFVLDSIPGMPKPDYLHLGFMYLKSMRFGLEREINLQEQKLPITTDKFERYKLEREIGAYRARLKFVKSLWEQIEKNPALKGAYELYFGGPGRLGLWHFFHPITAFKNWVIGKNTLAGLGISGLVDVLSYSLRHGPEVGGRVTEEVLKQFAVLTLKYIGYKLGFYTIEKIPGLPGGRFVFKPWYEFKLKLKEFIHRKLLRPTWEGTKRAIKSWATKTAASLAKTAAGKGIKAVGAKILLKIGSFLAKLGIRGLAALAAAATVIGSVISVILIVWQIVEILWPLIKRVLKAWGAAFLLLLAWVLQNGLPAILGALGGLFFLSPIFSLVLGPFLGILASIFAGASAGIFISKFISSLSGLAGGIASGIGSFLGGLSLPSLAGYAAPVLGISGLAVTVPTLIYFMVVSEAFVQPGQPSPVQSKYITLTKTAQFSGNLGEPIIYTLTVSATSRLTNIKISETLNFTCKGSSPSISPPDLSPQTPAEIQPGQPLSLTYQLPTDQQFNDCLVTNNALVTADLPQEGEIGEKSFASANISIGNPPVVVPQGLPLKGNVCLSGYDFNEITADGSRHQGIDIKSDQLTVYSAFPQESRVINVCNIPSCLNTPGGYSLTLGLGPYVIYLGHLANPANFNLGDSVPALAAVGTTGDTGTKAFGAHVHYLIYKNGVAVNPHGFGANPPKCP